MKNRHAVLACIACVCATFGAAGPVLGQAGELTPSQLRVVWAADPAHRATISWTTLMAGTTHVVHYDIQGRGGVVADYAMSSDAVVSGEYATDGPYFHHASVADLPADTDVYFVVETDGELSSELHFRTAPVGEDSFKLLYGGDSRTGRRDRQRMNQRIAASTAEDPEILALVHGGDYIAYATNWSQWNDWLDDHELTIGADGRVLPLIPAKGNHEGRGVLYNHVFATPSGDPDKNWFYTELGQVALVTLDTEASLAGEQRDWLRERLIEGRNARWLIVNYHRPAFPAVKSPSGAREHWVPLFEEFDVDLVCESDGHALKRTPPIRSERVDFTGVTYVGEGGLGVPRRTPVEGHWYLDAPGMAASAHHVQKIEISKDLLRYQALLMDGSVADEVTILPREERLSQRITATMAAATSANHVEVSFSKAFDPVTAVEATWELDPAVPIEGIEIGSQVGAVLALANAASQDELDEDVGLDARAAAKIVAFRAGEDGQLDTDDDLTFETWAELDAVSYVGTSALQRLTSYALANSANERNVVSLEVGNLEPGVAYRVRVPRVEDRNGTPVGDGTTVSFTYTDRDDRADAIERGEPVTSEGGCSTAAGSGSDAWLLALLGLGVVQRRRR